MEEDSLKDEIARRTGTRSIRRGFEQWDENRTKGTGGSEISEEQQVNSRSLFFESNSHSAMLQFFECSVNKADLA